MNQKGCMKRIGYKGNIDIRCGANICNNIYVQGLPIHYCNKCLEEANKVAPTVKDSGEVIGKYVSFEISWDLMDYDQNKMHTLMGRLKDTLDELYEVVGPIGVNDFIEFFSSSARLNEGLKDALNKRG